MRREHYIYGAIPAAFGMFFWSNYFLIFAISAGAVYFLYSKGIFRLLWKLLSQRKGLDASTSAPSAPAVDLEPTLITLVARAPNQLLGVDQDAGTATIFHSFYQQVKEEQNDSLRLNKKGRRLTAAKNEMLSRRRKRGRPDSPSSESAQRELSESLKSLLKFRPVYSGKVIQFTNLTSSLTEKFKVGAEVEDLGLTGTCGEEEHSSGRGSSRLVIQSQSGRLLGSSGDGQVAFLPGTRFLIVARNPWQNPSFPGSPSGFTFELVELA